jgi:hypothetical protein
MVSSTCPGYNILSLLDSTTTSQSVLSSSCGSVKCQDNSPQIMWNNGHRFTRALAVIYSPVRPMRAMELEFVSDSFRSWIYVPRLSLCRLAELWPDSVRVHSPSPSPLGGFA